MGSPVKRQLATAALVLLAAPKGYSANGFQFGNAQQHALKYSGQTPFKLFSLPAAGAQDGSNYTPPAGLQELAEQLAASKFKKVVVLIGAGVSVAAGIPDFRTPGTGLYSKLEEYNLPYPEAIFELDYFLSNPRPFVDIAQAIWPGQENGPRPTLAHSFVALLEKRGLLNRVYSQNIDGLERAAGVSPHLLIECHGHFSTCSCTQCSATIDPQECQDSFTKKGEVMKCPDCQSFCKPDVVFFGEQMPSCFMEHINEDMNNCDLLIVMGTSLLVAPVASIPSWVSPKVPRLLINRDLVGSFAMDDAWRAAPSRDMFLQGDCDDGVLNLCKLAGWATELATLHDDDGTV